MRLKRITSSLIVLLSVSVPLSLGATQFDSMSWEDRLARSDLVAMGRVVQCDAQWGKQYIYRDCLFEIRETFHGTVRDAVVIRSFGGSVGDYTLMVSGMPTLKQYRDLFLFLRQDGNNETWHVVGLSQGEFEVWGESLVESGNLPGRVADRNGPFDTILTLEDVRTLVALGY